MLNTYSRVTATLPAEMAEIVLAIALKHNSSGSSEELSFVQRSLAFDPIVDDTKNKCLSFYFDSTPDMAFFEELNELQIKYQWSEEPHKDWLEIWKKDFKEFPICDPFWVVPSWTPWPKNGEPKNSQDEKIPIFLDPGMAFGTGTHATTQMISDELKRTSSEMATGKQDVNWFLDVGTGTGILSIVAYKMGARNIHAVDVDSEALRVAGENFVKNEVAGVGLTTEIPSHLTNRCRWVAANIVDGVLLKLKSDLLKSCSPEGHFFLSGILAENEDSFIEQFLEGTDLIVNKRLQSDGWISYHLCH
jgi:ribosomal protein L11 methyltransferase